MFNVFKTISYNKSTIKHNKSHNSSNFTHHTIETWMLLNRIIPFGKHSVASNRQTRITRFHAPTAYLQSEISIICIGNTNEYIYRNATFQKVIYLLHLYECRNSLLTCGYILQVYLNLSWFKRWHSWPTVDSNEMGVCVCVAGGCNDSHGCLEPQHTLTIITIIVRTLDLKQ